MKKLKINAADFCTSATNLPSVTQTNPLVTAHKKQPRFEKKREYAMPFEKLWVGWLCGRGDGWMGGAGGRVHQSLPIAIGRLDIWIPVPVPGEMRLPRCGVVLLINISPQKTPRKAVNNSYTET